MTTRRMERVRLTPWLPGVLAPHRTGVYRVQTHESRCNCCWAEALFDGKHWLFQVHGRGQFTVEMPFGVRRWRGLSSPPAPLTGPGGSP